MVTTKDSADNFDGMLLTMQQGMPLSSNLVHPLQPQYSNLQSLRTDMEACIKSFIQGGNAGKVLYLQVPAGAGKSHVTTDVINQLYPPGPDEVLWFGSMHDQFDDLKDSNGVSLRSTNWVHIKGRRSGAQGNCMYASEAKILYDRGLPVTKALCGTYCRGKGKCDYWKRYRDPGHKFLPHQLLFYYDGSKSPLVVFDELDTRIFLETYEVNSNELTKQIRNGNTGFWKLLQAALYKGISLSGIDLYDYLKRGKSYQELFTYVGKLRFTDMKISNPKDAQGKARFGMGETVRRVMLYELKYLIRGLDFNPRIHVYPSPKNDYIEINIRHDPPNWLKNKPIILLGAKGEPDLFHKVLKKCPADFISYSPKMPFPAQVDVMQEAAELLPKGNVKDSRNQTLIHGAIDAQMDKGQDVKTCLICHKEFEQAFATLFGLNATKYESEGKVIGNYQDTCHYWGIRGLNAWKDYDQIILIGNPTPNLADSMRQVEALYWDSSKLNKKPVKSPKGVWRYNDSRLNYYLRSLREDELYQAIFRIRPLDLGTRSKVKIIIATALPLQDVPKNTKRFNILLTSGQNKSNKQKKVTKAAKDLLKSHGGFTRKELVNEVQKASAGFGKTLGSRTITDYLEQNIVGNLKLKTERTKFGIRYKT